MFKSEKTKQLIGYLLSKSAGTMNYTKLLKLMYIIDRNSLQSRGFPITYDSYVSMNNGPVLSITYDVIKKTQQDTAVNEYTWAENLRRADDIYSVSWVGELEIGKLSRSDIRLIDCVWEEFGEKNYSQLIDYVHEFKEWEAPNGTSTSISYEKLLKELGYNEEDRISIANAITKTTSIEELFTAYAI
jgi:uncharacterized phage-associated protein